MKSKKKNVVINTNTYLKKDNIKFTYNKLFIFFAICREIYKKISGLIVEINAQKKNIFLFLYIFIYFFLLGLLNYFLYTQFINSFSDIKNIVSFFDYIEAIPTIPFHLIQLYDLLKTYIFSSIKYFYFFSMHSYYIYISLILSLIFIPLINIFILLIFGKY
jgi:hypothetical protein